ncbi:FG-GAP repeat domain-containing protein [Streptomyces sp. NPDC088387]|uniref:FG-GAP repeat domain-containing protein n=1 Tax=Streptomyces sp. NPDC088387 TaxID=3365859 RepID=UPI00381799E2
MRVRRSAICVVAALTLLPLAACGPSADPAPADRPPVNRAADAAPGLPVPRGDGSDTPDDFNGDGRRDLVLDDLVKDQEHADDAGIGIVYGGPDGLAPGARQLISPGRQAARTKGQAPNAFDAEASCDLDGDGFTDLVVSTDPPYDGQGQPPVPLQILFGSSGGLTGKAVKLVVPAAARAGKDWPDQPVCGDFDGDEKQDLVVHASDEQLSYLRGPFSRKGAPRAAGAPIPAPGNVPSGPAADVDRDGNDDLVIRTADGEGTAYLVLGGADGPDGTAVELPPGSDIALAPFGQGKPLDAAIGSADGIALRYDLPDPTRATLPAPGTLLDAADFDGDGRADLVVGAGGTGAGEETGDGDGAEADEAGGAENSRAIRLYRGRTTGLDPEPAATVTPAAPGTTRVLAVGDFDGDGRADLVVRTYRGETRDSVAVYPGTAGKLVGAEPVVTFSTAEFLGLGNSG